MPKLPARPFAKAPAALRPALRLEQPGSGHLSPGEEAQIVDDAPLPGPGDIACRPALRPLGQSPENRRDAPAPRLTLGSRLPKDVIHHPDHDLIAIKDGPARHYSRADGTPYPLRRKP